MSYTVYIPEFLVYFFVWLLWIAGPLLLLAVGLGSAYNLYKTTPGYVSVIRAARALRNKRALFSDWEKRVKDLEQEVHGLRMENAALYSDLLQERAKGDPNLHGYPVDETAKGDAK